MDRREVTRKWYQSFDEKTMKFIIEGEEEMPLEIPAIYSVCSTCDGKGKHVNPSIDSHGISEEEFHMDPDFEEAYFSGAYDIVCNTCHGNRVEPEVDWISLSSNPKLSAYVQSWIDDFWNGIREEEMERRMGA